MNTVLSNSSIHYLCIPISKFECNNLTTYKNTFIQNESKKRTTYKTKNVLQVRFHLNLQWYDLHFKYSAFFVFKLWLNFANGFRVET